MSFHVLWSCFVYRSVYIKIVGVFAGPGGDLDPPLVRNTRASSRGRGPEPEEDAEAAEKERERLTRRGKSMVFGPISARRWPIFTRFWPF